MSRVPCLYRIKPCKIYQKVPLEQPGTWSYQSGSKSVLPLLSELLFYIYTAKYGRHASQFCRRSHTEVHTYCSVTHSIASTYLLIYWCCVYAWVCVQCARQRREENEYVEVGGELSDVGSIRWLREPRGLNSRLEVSLHTKPASWATTLHPSFVHQSVL